MEQVIRQSLIDQLGAAVSDSQMVTVSANAGGGVSTALEQWIRFTGQTATVGRCPDFTPQRPLAGFQDIADEEAIAAIRAGNRHAAAQRLESQYGDVFVIDDADHLDEASLRLAVALLDNACKLVLGHHHAPPTNPSLELLLARIPTSERSSIVVPPLEESDIETALGDAADPAAARAATHGNPLALSLYRGPDFASISAAVAERFDRLTADGQALAAILAASPEPVPLDLVESIGLSWETQGRPLEQNGLAAAADDAVCLRHDKIRRVLYEELTPLRRRFVHAEILSHLSGEDDLTLMMYHAVGAGDVETLIAVGPRAADRAGELGAHREAARHLENVLTYEHSVPEADRSILRAARDKHLMESSVDQTV